jgi:gastrin-releasing peptide receptor
MNHRNFIITTVAFHLTFVAMKTEQFMARPASGEKENETSTEQREVEILIKSESLMLMDSKVDNATNGNSEIYSLLFEKSYYQFNCTEDIAHEIISKTKPYFFEPASTPSIISGTDNIRQLYEEMIKSAELFACTPNEDLGHFFISVSRRYVETYSSHLRFPNSISPIEKMWWRNISENSERVLQATIILYIQYMIELAEKLNELIREHNEIKAIKETIVENFYESTAITLVSLWPDIVRKQEKLVTLLQSCVERAVNASQYREEHGFPDILISDHNSYLLNVSYWTDLLEDEDKRLQGYKSEQLIVQNIHYAVYTAAPPVMVTVFGVGILGNGLLLSIFIRHKETRTFQNSMLMNLAVVDCLTLLMNVLLDYFRLRSNWQLGVPICKLYVLSCYMFTDVSIYSVVTLSVQRFMAVRKFPSGALGHVGRKATCLVVATVWALGVILSLPRALLADVNIVVCNYTPFKGFITTDFVVFCIVPAILVAVFSVLTAARIRRSAGSIAGEGAGQERLRQPYRRLRRSDCTYGCIRGLLLAEFPV